MWIGWAQGKEIRTATVDEIVSRAQSEKLLGWKRLRRNLSNTRETGKQARMS